MLYNYHKIIKYKKGGDDMLINLVKVFIEIGVSLLYIFLFNIGYKIVIKDIHRIMSEINASDSYMIFKYISYMFVVFVGLLFILLNTNNTSKIFVILEFVIFFILFFYVKSSLKLMDHFVSYLYRPKLLEDKEFSCLVGELSEDKSNWTFQHFFANIEITERIREEKQGKQNLSFEFLD